MSRRQDGKVERQGLLAARSGCDLLFGSRSAARASDAALVCYEADRQGPSLTHSGCDLSH